MIRHNRGGRLYYVYKGRHLPLDRLLEIAHNEYGNTLLVRHNLDRRLRRGWTVEQALSIPVGSSRPGERHKPHKWPKRPSLTKEEQQRKLEEKRRKNRLYYREHRDHIRYISYQSKFKVWLQRYATMDKLDDLESMIEKLLQQKTK